ncbi:MAG: tRNA adenosine(34) deaminase TadA [Candidatus Aminicenantes bacterium]|nr:tRNA adenosine(34) deaminase TadA [Candidatus Aminicenantes bacterium]
MMKKDDFYFMRQALKEAEQARKKNEVPVGAVIVSGGNILSRAHNQCVSLNDPTAHAEILAIREACQVKGNERLNDCDLYVTLEPCPMCAGAAVLSRLKRLVYGADDPKGGGIRSIMEFPFNKTNHTPEIKRGFLSEECGKILKDFFRSKR